MFIGNFFSFINELKSYASSLRTVGIRLDAFSQNTIFLEGKFIGRLGVIFSYTLPTTLGRSFTVLKNTRNGAYNS